MKIKLIVETDGADGDEQTFDEWLYDIGELLRSGYIEVEEAEEIS